MKISEVLQENTSYDYVKTLEKEFKQIAARYDLTIVAPIGFPVQTTKGAWFGGGLAAKGGSRAPKDALVPVDVRVKGFLKALSKRLEQLIEAGNSVKVASGRGRSIGQDDATKENALDLLTKYVVTLPPPHASRREDMPTVYWYVSVPQEQNVTTYLSFVTTLHLKNISYHFKALVHFPLPTEQANSLIKNWNKLKKTMRFDTSGAAKSNEANAVVLGITRELNRLNKVKHNAWNPFYDVAHQNPDQINKNTETLEKVPVEDVYGGSAQLKILKARPEAVSRSIDAATFLKVLEKYGITP